MIFEPALLDGLLQDDNGCRRHDGYSRIHIARLARDATTLKTMTAHRSDRPQRIRWRMFDLDIIIIIIIC
jgi:hypothetical protein